MSELQAWRQAEAWLSSGNLSQAGAAYEALTRSPQFAPVAWLRLSLISSRSGHHRQATEQALAAYRVRQRDAGLMSMLAKRLLSLGELEKAIECATAPEVHADGDASIPAELGKLMTDAFEPASALGLLNRACSLGLDTPAVRYLCGICLMYLGEVRRAREELLSCLRSAPGYARAYWALAKMAGRNEQGIWVDGIRKALAQETDVNAQALLYYALFKQLDVPGNEAEAWNVLSQGMALRRAHIRYDAEAEGALFRFLERQPPLRAVSDAAVSGPQPIFVVGMPRTGTTLLESLLARHEDIVDGGELHDFVLQLRWQCDLQGSAYLDLPLAQRVEQVDLRETGRRYLDHTQWRARGATWFTDKMPVNFFNVRYIAASLPGSRIIHMMRDPVDTCFSSLKEPFSGAYFHSYDQTEMALHFKRYRRLMAHWQSQLPGRVLDVVYEDLVATPEDAMSKVMQFCGVEHDSRVASREGVTGEVTTASANQLREGVHTGYVGQWQRYAEYLTPTIECLQSDRS